MSYNNYNSLRNSKHNLKIGKKGELFAEQYLKKRGYLFIARNYWTQYGEIDLVFLKGFSLVFVEVKTRSHSEYGTGREAVNFYKKKHIIKTSEEFINAHCKDGKVPFYIWKFPIRLCFFKIRYDVIEVSVQHEGYLKNNNLLCSDPESFYDNNDLKMIKIKQKKEYSINAHLKGYFSYK